MSSPAELDGHSVLDCHQHAGTDQDLTGLGLVAELRGLELTGYDQPVPAYAARWQRVGITSPWPQLADGCCSWAQPHCISVRKSVHTRIVDAKNCRDLLVGVAGFEPATPCSRSRCATRLRYTPISRALSSPLSLLQGALFDRLPFLTRSLYVNCALMRGIDHCIRATVPRRIGA